MLGIFCSPCFSWIVPCSWSGGSYSCHQSIAFCHIQLDSFFKICLQTRQTSSDRRSELRVLLLAVSAYKNNTENLCRYQWWWHQPITGQSSWHLTNVGWLGLLCTMQSIRPWAAGEDTPEASQPPDSAPHWADVTKLRPHWLSASRGSHRPASRKYELWRLFNKISIHQCF